MTSNRSGKLLLFQNFLAIFTFTFAFTSSRPRGALTPKRNNLWLHLVSWNLPDSQLCLGSKTVPSVAKGGGHRTEKTYTERGDCESKSVASSYKLELARFSTSLRIQDRAECCNGDAENHILVLVVHWKNKTPKTQSRKRWVAVWFQLHNIALHGYIL